MTNISAQILTTQPLLEARDLGYSLEENKQPLALIQGVNLSIAPASINVLIGANGSGKSSLLRLLTHEWHPSSGQVQFNGRAMSDWSPRLKAQWLAVLPQGSQLNFAFTVTEVVALGRVPHATGIERDQAIVAEVLQQVDATHLAERLYTELSGGEQQRVQLARVLAQVWETEEGASDYHRLLVLDEPAAFFDLAHQQLLLTCLQTLKQRGIAVLMVAHDLNLAYQSADQVLLLRCGELIAAGNPQQVMTTDQLESVLGTPIEQINHPQTGQSLFVPKLQANA